MSELPMSRAISGPARAVVAAVLGGVLLSACGSGGGEDSSPKSTSSGSAATPDAGDASKAPSGGACDIISDDVASAVLGVKIVRREGNGEPGSASVSCIKGLERSNDPKQFSYVSASVLAGGGSTLVDQAKTIEGNRPVAGLGDRALFVPSVGGLFIVDGADGVQVQIVKAGKPGSEQDCVTVAKDLLSRR